jgi:hypothetical protein
MPQEGVVGQPNVEWVCNPTVCLTKILVTITRIKDGKGELNLRCQKL